MPTQSALERAGYAINEFVPWEHLDNETISLMHADYVRATIDRIDATSVQFDFRIPRKEIISEIQRMNDYLKGFDRLSPRVLKGNGR